MSVAKQLAKMAKEKGICKEWYNQLLVMDDKEEMVKMYLKGIDFCLSNNYPSLDFIRKNFVGVMEKHGVHVDAELVTTNERYSVALGKCFGVLNFNEFNIAEVFLKHGSNLLVTAHNDSFVMIDLFDNSIITVYAQDNAKVVINQYGGKISGIEKFGNALVKIKPMYKKTY